MYECKNWKEKNVKNNSKGVNIPKIFILQIISMKLWKHWFNRIIVLEELEGIILYGPEHLWLNVCVIVLVKSYLQLIVFFLKNFNHQFKKNSNRFDIFTYHTISFRPYQN